MVVNCVYFDVYNRQAKARAEREAAAKKAAEERKKVCFKFNLTVVHLHNIS